MMMMMMMITTTTAAAAAVTTAERAISPETSLKFSKNTAPTPGERVLRKFRFSH